MPAPGAPGEKKALTPDEQEQREVATLVLVVATGFFVGVLFLFAIVASGTL